MLGAKFHLVIIIYICNKEILKMKTFLYTYTPFSLSKHKRGSFGKRNIDLEGGNPLFDGLFLVVKVSPLEEPGHHHLLLQGQVDDALGRHDETLEHVGLLEVQGVGVDEEALGLALVDLLDHGLGQQVEDDGLH